jgi:hypothetical protein
MNYSHSSILLVIGLFFHLVFSAYAPKPEKKSYEFLGTIILQDQTMHSYKLVFTSDSGKIKGYSIEDIGGNFETKARISGTYQPATGSIQFKEQDILYTHYKNDKKNICMAIVSGKLKKNRQGTSIEAKFNGEFLGTKKSCGSGRMILMSSQDVYAKLADVSKKISTIQTSDSALKSLQEAIRPVKDVKDITEITANDVYTVNWNSNKIRIHFWDDGFEDNDQITIKLNDSIVRSNCTITKNKQELILPFNSKGECTLQVTANNEGNYSPNTVKMVLLDGDKNYLLLTRLKKGELFKIVLNNKK